MLCLMRSDVKSSHTGSFTINFENIMQNIYLAYLRFLFLTLEMSLPTGLHVALRCSIYNCMLPFYLLLQTAYWGLGW